MSNATAGDLWHHIGQASGREVAEVAASWTDQAGFPLVSVASRCEQGRTQVRLTQQRFWLQPHEPAASVWKIPIRLARGAMVKDLLFEQPAQNVELPGCVRAPLVVNAGGVGFYRVHYAPAERRALADAFTRLAPPDRLTLLSDSVALAQAGHVTWPDAFDLFAALPKVNDASRPALFDIAIRALQFLDTALAGTPAQARLRAAGRALLAPELQRLGWQPRAGEDPEISRLRGALIESLARLDDANVAREALRRFDADAAGRAALPASTRAAVIRAVGRAADGAHFDTLLERLRRTDSEEDRWTYARALATGLDAQRATRLLQVTVDGSLPPNIAAAVPGLMGEHSPHTALAYDFTLNHWDKLAALSGGVFGDRTSLLPDAALGFNDAARAKALVTDQAGKAGADGAAAAAKAALQIEMMARVKERDAETLAAYLERWPARR
jgi:aminopeptidase N